jgi:general secretion pathway protein J
MSGHRAYQRGVTLPELLVALLIFAMISSVGVYALRLGVDGREQLLETDERLREWQLARLTIRQDLAQVVSRAVRDEFGAPQPGPFLGGIGFSGRTPIAEETPLVAFVRGGWNNIDATTPRSTLQYVEYVLKEDDIVRRTRTYLDDARDQPERDRILFEDVEDVELEFLLGETSRGLEWGENWPAPGARSAPPRAIRLMFTSEHYGEIEQLFWLGEITGSLEP